MQQRQLGNSGLFVSVLGLGGNTFGAPCDETETTKIIHTALDAGVTLIDTADVYSDGVSEEYVGKAIRGRRDEVIPATKTGWRRSEEDGGRLSRRSLISAVDASLVRLQCDYIDPFYLHHPDPDTTSEETLNTLDSLVWQGKIRYLGCSNYSGWQLADLAGRCEALGTTPLIASQSEYSLVKRDIETEVLPAARRFGYGLVAYAPLASGFLTGKYQQDKPIPEGVRGAGNERWQRRRFTGRNFEIISTLERYDARDGRSIANLAIAWVAAQNGVCSVLVGATNSDQVLENVESISTQLPPSLVIELSESSASSDQRQLN